MDVKLIHPHLLQCENEAESSLFIGKKLTGIEQGELLSTAKSPLWLIDCEWNALAECSIVNALNVADGFRCDYLYQADEVQMLSKTVVRLFAGEVDPYIYLLSSKQDYMDAIEKGDFRRESLEDEGFIHATPYSQLTRLANKYYQGVLDPHVLKIDKQLIKPKVKWEPAKGGLYPHIYGPLNSDAIVAIEPIFLNDSGEFNIS